MAKAVLVAKICQFVHASPPFELVVNSGVDGTSIVSPLAPS